MTLIRGTHYAKRQCREGRTTWLLRHARLVRGIYCCRTVEAVLVGFLDYCCQFFPMFYRRWRFFSEDSWDFLTGIKNPETSEMNLVQSQIIFQSRNGEEKSKKERAEKEETLIEYRERILGRIRKESGKNPRRRRAKKVAREKAAARWHARPARKRKRSWRRRRRRRRSCGSRSKSRRRRKGRRRRRRRRRWCWCWCCR